MKSPRSLSDLPFAAELRPFDGELELDGDYDRLRFDGSAFVDADAGGLRVMECAFTGVTFDGGQVRRSRLSDVWFSETRLVGCDVAESSWTDVDLRGAALGGDASGSGGAAVAGIRAGYDSLRGTRIDTVQLMTLAPLLAHHLGITVENA
jgi:uncharacterized protein YjbI with pentapeptide repeats